MLIAMAFSMSGFAQQVTVSGKIVDSKTGAPLAGATIKVKIPTRLRTLKPMVAFQLKRLHLNRLSLLPMLVTRYSKQKQVVGKSMYH